MNTNICAVGIILLENLDIGIQQRMPHVEHGINEVVENMPKRELKANYSLEE